MGPDGRGGVRVAAPEPDPPLVRVTCLDPPSGTSAGALSERGRDLTRPSKPEKGPSPRARRAIIPRLLDLKTPRRRVRREGVVAPLVSPPKAPRATRRPALRTPPQVRPGTMAPPTADPYASAAPDTALGPYECARVGVAITTATPTTIKARALVGSYPRRRDEWPSTLASDRVERMARRDGHASDPSGAITIGPPR